MSMTHQTVTGREHLELRGPAGQERLTCRLCGSSVPTWPWPDGMTRRRMFAFARLHDACGRPQVGAQVESRMRPGDSGAVRGIDGLRQIAEVCWYEDGEVEYGVPWGELRVTHRAEEGGSDG